MGKPGTPAAGTVSWVRNGEVIERYDDFLDYYLSMMELNKLDTADLNRPDVFQTAFWQHWADKPTWFCLLPPSPLAHYADTLKQWLALAEHMGVQHIVYTSSTSVYGNAVRVCDENTPPHPQTETAVQILAAEKILLAGRIPHIDILRLGGLYSATRHPLDRLLLKNNIRGGRQPVNVIHQDSAVAALFQTACTPDGHRLRNLVETPHPSRRSFYAAEAAKLGLPVPQFAEGGGRGRTVQTRYGDFSAILQLADTAG